MSEWKGNMNRQPGDRTWFDFAVSPHFTAHVGPAPVKPRPFLGRSRSGTVTAAVVVSLVEEVVAAKVLESEGAGCSS